MVKIPKFYVKVDTAPVGSDNAGKKCWWVSNGARIGFVVHPAFVDEGTEIDQIYIGKYEATNDGGTKVGSVSGVSPLVNINYATMQTRCENRNVAGVEGFHAWSIYDLAAIQILALIELETPDVQSAIANGNVDSSSAANTGTTDAIWRGIYELWGNVRHMTDGLHVDGSHQVKVWDINGNRTYESTGVTTTTSDGWSVTMHDESGSGWDLSMIFLPKTTDSAEDNGTFGDCFYASDSGEYNVTYHGGTWNHGSQSGLFSPVLFYTGSDTYNYNGGRLAKW